MSKLKSMAVLGLLVLVGLVPRTVGSEPVTTIKNAGPNTNRVNLVFLGDGYTSTEMGPIGGTWTRS